MSKFIGTSKNDNLIGSIYNDDLDGGQGNDTLTGGAGSDFFNITSGIDTITDLGNGPDILTVSFGASVSATLAQAWTATSKTKNSGNVKISTAGMSVDLSSADTGGGRYEITNTSSKAVILKGSIDTDILVGGSGDDTLDGGKGNDNYLGKGNDTLTGGTGADFFKVTAGIDTITDLGNGADILVVDMGATTIATLTQSWTAKSSTKNSGIVKISTAGLAVDLSSASTGGGQYEVTNTSSIGVSLKGSADTDLLIGGSGVDTIDAGFGFNTITGGSGADFFKITGSDTITDLGNGSDQIVINLNSSATATLAQTWTATASTKNSGLLVITTAGMNVNLSSAVIGGGFYSLIDSSQNGTNLIGSSDCDYFFGNEGDDTLTGGAGADIFNVTAGTDTITDLGNGADLLNVESGATVVATIYQNWVATGYNKNSGVVKINTPGFSVDLSSVKYGGGQYEIKNTSANGVALTGSVDRDILIGNSGVDVLYGGQGNDTLTGGAGADIFNVTAGTDTITDLGNGSDILTVAQWATATATLAKNWAATASTKNSGVLNIDTAGMSVNLLSATAGGGQYNITNTSSTGAVITGSSDACSIFGGNGKDSISGGANNDFISGGGGDDSILGGDGLDSILGGDGNDTIVGSKGFDTLTGGSGSDTFVFSLIDVGDTITDFTSGIDKIKFDKYTFNSIKSTGTVGYISSDEFGSGANLVSSQTKSMHLIFDTTSGVLRYDPDGNGNLSSIVVSVIGVGTHPVLNYSDIIIG